MAESADSARLHWIDPQQRGIFPLDGFHLSRSLRRHLLRAEYSVTVNRDFSGVMRACADRPETWINAEILALYQQLHQGGQAHSLEVWQEGALVGGPRRRGPQQFPMDGLVPVAVVGAGADHLGRVIDRGRHDHSIGSAEDAWQGDGTPTTWGAMAGSWRPYSRGACQIGAPRKRAG